MVYRLGKKRFCGTWGSKINSNFYISQVSVKYTNYPSSAGTKNEADAEFILSP